MFNVCIPERNQAISEIVLLITVNEVDKQSQSQHSLDQANYTKLLPVADIPFSMDMSQTFYFNSD